MGLNLARVSNDEQDYDKVHVIQVKDLDRGQITDTHDLKQSNVPQGSKLERQKLRSGDVLVSARGTLLKCAVVRSAHVGCVASANFIIIRLESNSSLHPELLHAFLRQPGTQASLLSRVSGTAQPVLTIRDLEALTMKIPENEIQGKLAQLLRLSDEQYRTALEHATLVQEEALSIVAEYMEDKNA